METKVCRTCNAEKSVDDFANNIVKSTNGTRHIYKRSQCKKCDNDILKQKRVSRFTPPPIIEGETWKSVSEFKGLYEVSNFGNVRTVERYALKGNEQKMKVVQHSLSKFIRGSKNKLRYYSVFLSKSNKKGKHYSIHTLVAKAFVDNPYNLPQVNHIDSNTFNNKSDNLEWVTNKGNQVHSILQGRRKHLSQRVLILDKQNTPLILMGSIKKAAQVTGADRTSVREVCKGNYKSANGFKFQYLF